MTHPFDATNLRKLRYLQLLRLHLAILALRAESGASNV
jgi:hypothetical protein